MVLICLPLRFNRSMPTSLPAPAAMVSVISLSAGWGDTLKNVFHNKPAIPYGRTVRGIVVRPGIILRSDGLYEDVVRKLVGAEVIDRDRIGPRLTHLIKKDISVNRISTVVLRQRYEARLCGVDGGAVGSEAEEVGFVCDESGGLCPAGPLRAG